MKTLIVPEKAILEFFDAMHYKHTCIFHIEQLLNDALDNNNEKGEVTIVISDDDLNEMVDAVNTIDEMTGKKYKLSVLFADYLFEAKYNIHKLTLYKIEALLVSIVCRGYGLNDGQKQTPLELNSLRNIDNILKLYDLSDDDILYTHIVFYHGLYTTIDWYVDNLCDDKPEIKEKLQSVLTKLNKIIRPNMDIINDLLARDPIRVAFDEYYEYMKQPINEWQ